MSRITNALLNSLGDAEQVIHDLVSHENRPCDLDRHGNCQEHGTTVTDHDRGCAVRRGRELVGLDGPR